MRGLVGGGGEFGIGGAVDSVQRDLAVLAVLEGATFDPELQRRHCRRRGVEDGGAGRGAATQRPPWATLVLHSRQTRMSSRRRACVSALHLWRCRSVASATNEAVGTMMAARAVGEADKGTKDNFHDSPKDKRTACAAAYNLI
jgi:hypothetical protein